MVHPTSAHSVAIINNVKIATPKRESYSPSDSPANRSHPSSSGNTMITGSVRRATVPVAPSASSQRIGRRSGTAATRPIESAMMKVAVCSAITVDCATEYSGFASYT